MHAREILEGIAADEMARSDRELAQRQPGVTAYSDDLKKAQPHTRMLIDLASAAGWHDIRPMHLFGIGIGGSCVWAGFPPGGVRPTPLANLDVNPVPDKYRAKGGPAPLQRVGKAAREQ